MTAEMTKSAFVDGLKTDWAAWESLVASIPEDRLTEPGAEGDDWSVKDVIAHIMVYERWTSEWLEPALKGEAPAWNYSEDDKNLSMDEQNDRFFKENRDRPLDEIRSEAAKVHARMVAAVEQVPDDKIAVDMLEFSPPLKDYYQAGTKVWQAIDGNAGGHYRDHTNDVRKWLEK